MVRPQASEPRGHPTRTGPSVSLAVRLPERLHRALRVHCIRSDVTFQSFVAQAVVERLRRVAGKRRAARR